MINILNAKTTHSIGIHEETLTLEELKIKQLRMLADMEPILARGVADHLIEFKQDEEVVSWRSELLEQMQTADIQILRILLEKRKELQQKTY